MELPCVGHEYEFDVPFAPIWPNFACYLIVRGQVSLKGHFGHLGLYDRELIASKTVEARPLQSNDENLFRIFGQGR
jgi:hypothetical protein